MWRIGPAFSPSRASRAAVSASSGMPSAPQASSAWLTPARRKMPWSVRTWRSSPECELARIAISAGWRSNAADAARLDERERAERLDRRTEGDHPVRIAEDADELAAGVGLDDVAAVDALLDPVAELADEDRASRRCGGPPCGPWVDEDAAPRVRSRLGRSPWMVGHSGPRGYRGGGAGASVRCVVTPRHSPPRRRRSARARPNAPRLAASGGPAQAGDPARRGHRAEEVPRGRARAVLAARATRRSPTSSVKPIEIRTPIEPMTASRAGRADRASCRSCGPASAWSTRCSS